MWEPLSQRRQSFRCRIAARSAPPTLSSGVAPQRGMKDSDENPHYKLGEKAKVNLEKISLGREALRGFSLVVPETETDNLRALRDQRRCATAVAVVVGSRRPLC